MLLRLLLCVFPAYTAFTRAFVPAWNLSGLEYYFIFFCFPTALIFLFNVEQGRSYESSLGYGEELSRVRDELVFDRVG